MHDGDFYYLLSETDHSGFQGSRGEKSLGKSTKRDRCAFNYVKDASSSTSSSGSAALCCSQRHSGFQAVFGHMIMYQLNQQPAGGLCFVFIFIIIYKQR